MHAGPLPAPLPDVVLYGKQGCHLCEETRAVLGALLDQRAAAGGPTLRIVERDITTDPDWERAFFLTIPVVELAGRRLELATSIGKLRVFLSDALDGDVPGHDGPDRTGGGLHRAVDSARTGALKPAD